LRSYLKPPALTLIKDGRVVRDAMRKEMISEDELKAQLREQGAADVAAVKLARLDGDGRLSVLKKSD
jgi:uncharacterized membrane protein YcaP (DUF421 family)